MTLHAATCVSVGGRGLLIEGAPGSGKSSLALALIDRGAQLVGDDGVELALRGGYVWALPPPNIAGLLEVRNVGIIRLPAAPAPLVLIVKLDPDAARLPEAVETAELLGLALPVVRLWPGSPALVLRAERALAELGLQ